MKKLIAISAALAMLTVAGSVSASGGHGSSGQQTTIDIDVVNSASVTNTVNTSASTGGNTANGGAAGSSADASGSGNSNAASSATGGDGGGITTGNAGALSDVANAVNSTSVEVTDSCGCDNNGNHHRRGGSRTTIDVDVNNSASVTNTVDTKAKTGYNTANGAAAESSADASSTSQQNHHWRHHNSNSNSSNADSVAMGGNGGTITTGNADAASILTTVVNTNIVRVTR